MNNFVTDDGESEANKMRKNTKMTEKIIDNFRVHLGANDYVQDVYSL